MTPEEKKKLHKMQMEGLAEMRGESRTPTQAAPKPRLTYRAAYYTIQDLRGGGSRHAFNVRGYDACGNLLLHTWHTTESSMQIECEAWKSRGAHERTFNFREEK